MSEKEARWGELVRAWRASGMTARGFGAERGISESSLRWWASRLAKQERTEARKPSSGAASDASSGRGSVALARVVRRGELPAEEDVRIAVVIGQVRVAVRRGFDPSVLRDVVRVLEEAR